MMPNQSGEVQNNFADCWIGISISGPSLVSWSIVLEVDLPLNEAEKKLKEFKESIKLKAKTESFAFFSVDWDDSEVMDSEYEEYPRRSKFFDNQTLPKTKAFKKIFPDIPLTFIYNNSDLRQFSCNSISDGKFFHESYKQ